MKSIAILLLLAGSLTVSHNASAQSDRGTTLGIAVGAGTNTMPVISGYKYGSKAKVSPTVVLRIGRRISSS